MMEKTILTRFEIFNGAPDESVESICKSCTLREFERDESIFEQGRPGSHLYGLLDGEIELLLIFMERTLHTNIEYEERVVVEQKEDQKPISFDVISPGEILGWSSMVIPPGKWTATARSVQAGRLFSVPADALKKVLEAHPEFGYLFMSRLAGIISQRLHKRTEKLIEAWGEAFDVEAT